MALDDFRFSHRLTVRWSEVDMQAVVFNGHYLTYFDVAFTEYWRATGLEGPIEQAQSGFEMFARKSTIEYHASARFDDVLDIYVRCARLGRSSLQILLEIHRAPMEATMDAPLDAPLEVPLEVPVDASMDASMHTPADGPGGRSGDTGSMGTAHLISGELIYVYADARARSARPMPVRWREALCRFESTPPVT